MSAGSIFAATEVRRVEGAWLVALCLAAAAAVPALGPAPVARRRRAGAGVGAGLGGRRLLLCARLLRRRCRVPMRDNPTPRASARVDGELRRRSRSAPRSDFGHPSRGGCSSAPRCRVGGLWHGFAVISWRKCLYGKTPSLVNYRTLTPTRKVGHAGGRGLKGSRIMLPPEFLFVICLLGGGFRLPRQFIGR